MSFNPFSVFPVAYVCHSLCFLWHYFHLFILLIFFITPYGSLSVSNTLAVNLINVLRDGQGKPGRHSELEPEQSPVQSSRVVLLARNQPRSPKTIGGSLEDTNKPPSLISDGCINNTCTSLFDDAQVSPEPPLLSENRNSPLDDYTGCTPLIGKHKSRKQQL